MARRSGTKASDNRKARLKAAKSKGNANGATKMHSSAATAMKMSGGTNC